MDLVRWERPAPIDLWEAFDGLRGEMDRALDPFKSPDIAGLLDRPTAPAIDIVETEEEYFVVADLPGVEKRDLEVSVAGSLLTIKGEKKVDQDSGKIAAELKDGVLAVRIAKREDAKTMLIEVAVQ